jgi:uncharacterized membrane-anchored protein
MARARASLISLAVTGVVLSGVAFAETPAEKHQKAVDTAATAAGKALIRGPAEIPLKDEARLALPEHYGFVPRAEAAALMRADGNVPGDNLIGVVLPLGDDTRNWSAVLSFDPSGYVKDDDAKNWKSDELLTSLREGTEAANEHRAEIGVPEIQVTRWVEPPAYEAATHRLVWAAEVKNKVGPDNDPTINYNTYQLGRDGYVSLNLVTPASEVERDKADARTLLGSISYNSGKGYGDFRPSTDKVAAFGIAALVAGVAAKKLGLLAIIGVTIVKFAKVIAVAVAAFGAGIVKWWKARMGKSEPTA